jgi:acetyltransferase
MHLERAHKALDAAEYAGRRTMDAMEGQAMLRAVGIAVPRDRLATSPDEAAAAAREIGLPVALKLISADVLHKTDAGGVLLDVGDETTERAGFDALLQRAHATHPGAVIQGVQVQETIRGGREVILGIKRDPTFGPLVMFGMGGIYAEVLAGVSFRLAPLSRLDAEEMIAEVRSAKLLAGLRGGPPADSGALIDALVRVSWLAHACPRVSELDINPLLVLPEGQGAFAADVRLILR